MGRKVTSKSINKGFNNIIRVTSKIEKAVNASSKSRKPYPLNENVKPVSEETNDGIIFGVIIFCISILFGIILWADSESGIKGFGLFILCGIIGIIIGCIVAIAISANRKSDNKPINIPDNSETSTLVDLIKESVIKNYPMNDLSTIIEDVPTSDRKSLLTKGLDLALKEINQNISNINDNTESYIDSYIEKFNIEEYATPSNRTYFDYLLNLTINDLLHGVNPHRCTISGISLNFQSNENVLIVFQDVVFCKEVVKTSYIGTSSGISVKIARGVYYRKGNFGSIPLINRNIDPIRQGTLIFTNKSIYFYSLEQTIQYPYSKILVFVPFEDGIGIQTNRANAKSDFFYGLDGVASYNIFANIKNIQ